MPSEGHPKLRVAGSIPAGRTNQNNDLPVFLSTRPGCRWLLVGYSCEEALGHRRDGIKPYLPAGDCVALHAQLLGEPRLRPAEGGTDGFEVRGVHPMLLLLVLLASIRYVPSQLRKSIGYNSLSGGAVKITYVPDGRSGDTRVTCHCYSYERLFYSHGFLPVRCRLLYRSQCAPNKVAHHSAHS